jgi:hypothetical protein
VKSVKNFRYVQKTSAECNEDSYLAILHLSRVELHCKLQEKLHRVTLPLHRKFLFLDFAPRKKSIFSRPGCIASEILINFQKNPNKNLSKNPMLAGSQPLL